MKTRKPARRIISGMGELHLEVIKHRLLRDFNLDVRVHKPRVSYKETVAAAGRSRRPAAIAKSAGKRSSPKPRCASRRATTTKPATCSPTGSAKTPPCGPPSPRCCRR